MGAPGFPVAIVARLARRLVCDPGGNTLAIIAAALLPLLAMVGGSLDVGRGYLVQARLQQACDAGVLAARKKLGSDAAATGTLPPDTQAIGQRFFHTNFGTATYGTSHREFQMTLEDDFAISGLARAHLPTTLMAVFGEEILEIEASCAAQLTFPNTDVMMVIDVTGSMAQTNPDDTTSRMEALKAVLRNFHAQLEASALAGARIRYGFVPYSTNVNVGHLLRDEWVVSEWAYQSRELHLVGSIGTTTFTTASSPVSGLMTNEQVAETYPATTSGGSLSCPTRPADSVQTQLSQTSETREFVIGPPAGERVTRRFERKRHGSSYRVNIDGQTCVVLETRFVHYVDTFSEITQPSFNSNGQWVYDRLHRSVADWRNISNGCIEERQTYHITDYNNVDFRRALDLNLDLVPTEDPGALGIPVEENLLARIPGNSASVSLPASAITKWRPMLPDIIYARQLQWNGSGNFNPARDQTTHDYVAPALLGTAACPAPARKLGTMTASQLDDYLATLVPNGSTYHDIGMIWGGRLISPTGLFASENADLSPGNPTSRNLIFMTDGETAALDLSYSAYGLEPLDRRRWQPGSALTLTQTVEQRFAVACREVKKRGITVWVVGFGTDLGEVMRECAGEGRYFEAANAAELNAAFAAIGRRVSQLRIIS